MRNLTYVLLLTFFALSCTKSPGDVYPKLPDLSLDKLEILPAKIPGHEYADMVFVNNRTGFAITNSGEIIRTTNGGKHWTEQKPANAELIEIDFPVENTGYILGNDENGALLIKTKNSGDSWQILRLGNKDGRPLAMDFISETTGFMIFEGSLFFTEDGGLTWVQKSNISTYNLQDVFFTNIKTGYITTYNNGFLKTIDGGTQWQFIPMEGMSLNKIFNGFDETVCIANGTTLVNLETKEIIATLPQGINKLLYMTPEKCIAVGQHYEGGFLPYGDVYITNDNWKTNQHKKFEPSDALNFRAIAQIKKYDAMMISNGRLNNHLMLLSSK